MTNSTCSVLPRVAQIRVFYPDDPQPSPDRFYPLRYETQLTQRIAFNPQSHMSIATDRNQLSVAPTSPLKTEFNSGYIGCMVSLHEAVFTRVSALVPKVLFVTFFYVPVYSFHRSCKSNSSALECKIQM